MDRQRNKIVFVLGMHRSGTSLVAEMVHSMGFAVPGTLLEEIKPVNARGFWESRQVVEFNERCIREMGCLWYSIQLDSSRSLREGCWLQVRGQVAEFLKENLDLHGNLVIKDPRLCVLLGLWLSAIDYSMVEVKILFVNRSPYSVAASLSARDGFSPLTGHMLWLDSVFSVINDSSLLSSMLVLNYEKILEDADKASKLISDFLGTSTPASECLKVIANPALQRSATYNSQPHGFVEQMSSSIHAMFRHGEVFSAEMQHTSECEARYYRYVAERAEIVSALNETNKSLSVALASAVCVGEMHANALLTISEKDLQLENNKVYINTCHERISFLENDLNEYDAIRARLSEVESSLLQRDADVAHNAAYIAQCEQRIGELGEALSEFEALRARLAEVESSLLQRDADVAHNTAYIAECEARIGELGEALSEFEALRARLAEVESTLRERDADVAHNTAYIAQCEARIGELGEALTEFEALRARLAEVESALQERDADVAHNTAYIAECEARIGELDTTLNRLFSSKFIRLLEPHIKAGH